jgi:hypothetical protein
VINFKNKEVLLRMKKIEIISLAKKKAERRGISQEWIKETIRFPAQIVEGYGIQRSEIRSQRTSLLRRPDGD